MLPLSEHSGTQPQGRIAPADLQTQATSSQPPLLQGADSRHLLKGLSWQPEVSSCLVRNVGLSETTLSMARQSSRQTSSTQSKKPLKSTSTLWLIPNMCPGISLRFNIIPACTKNNDKTINTSRINLLFLNSIQWDTLFWIFCFFQSLKHHVSFYHGSFRTKEEASSTILKYCL